MYYHPLSHHDALPIWRARSNGKRHPRRRQRLPLARRQRGLVKVVDQLVEQPVPVDLGPEMHEHRAEADRRAIHEDEFAGRRDAAERPELAVDAAGELRSEEHTSELQPLMRISE